MSTAQKSRGASAKKSSGTSAKQGGRTGLMIGLGVLVVVVIAVVIALVARSGDDATSDVDVAGVEQTRAATVEGAALPPFVDPAGDAAVGLVAPSAQGASFDGTSIEIAAGEPTLLVFLAHWCPFCQDEVRSLTEWEASGGVPDGVRIVGIATGTASDRPNYPPSAWLEREQFPFPVIADSETQQIAGAFGLTSYPYFVLLDEAGSVVARASGQLSIDQIDVLLDQVL